MGVYLYDSGRIEGRVSSGYTALYASTEVTTYFFADTLTQEVVLQNQEVYLTSHSHNLEAVAATPATCTKNGNTAYYQCLSERCKKLFEDADGNTATTKEAVTIAAPGHDWSGEWTVIKEATADGEGKKETSCVRGCGQKKVVILPVIGAGEDNRSIEKYAEVAPQAPIKEATFNNSKQELLNTVSIISAAEKQLIEEGTDARVWLEIDKVVDLTEENREKIEAEARKIMGENLNITYFDIKLFKQIGNNMKTSISEPGIPIRITIKLPSELLNNNTTFRREYKILSLHEGESKPEVISGTFDKESSEFTFASDKFSTYAIVYQDVPVENSGDGGGTEEGGEGTESGGGTEDGGGTEGGEGTESGGGTEDGGGTENGGNTGTGGNSGNGSNTGNSGNSGNGSNTGNNGNSGNSSNPGDNSGSANTKSNRNNGNNDKSTTGKTVIQPGKDKKDEVPDTGVHNNSSYVIPILFISGLGILFGLQKKEIDNIVRKSK